MAENVKSVCFAALLKYSVILSHFVLVQDILWNHKCMRHGWFLPYEPTPNENGSWKQHYIACVQSLDVELSSRSVTTANTVRVLAFLYFLYFDLTVTVTVLQSP